ncbi:hypothetical protein Ddc_11786 [Ditylenchus destructor]|nr:hypothetical protein Ddc_11786 [Ditylenchus destructor]
MPVPLLLDKNRTYLYREQNGSIRAEWVSCGFSRAGTLAIEMKVPAVSDHRQSSRRLSALNEWNYLEGMPFGTSASNRSPLTRYSHCVFVVIKSLRKGWVHSESGCISIFPPDPVTTSAFFLLLCLWLSIFARSADTLLFIAHSLSTRFDPHQCQLIDHQLSKHDVLAVLSRIIAKLLQRTSAARLCLGETACGLANEAAKTRPAETTPGLFIGVESKHLG